MSSDLLQKLEEKIQKVLDDYELMKLELEELREENESLRKDKSTSIMQLQGILEKLEDLSDSDES